MDIRALRYFQIVAECGSYSRGSELLRISQPAVSRAIRALEDELGRPVFRRHGHGVTLTDAGRILLERAQLVIRQLEQAKAEIRSGGSGPSGTVSLAVPPAAGQYLIPAVAERFGRMFPNVFLKVVGGFSGYIHEWLVRGQVDLACVHDPLPQRGFGIIPLIDEEVFLVGRKGALPANSEQIDVEQLADLPLILPSRPNASRRLLDSWMGPLRTTLSIRIEVDDHTITRALVKEGVGFSLLTRCAIEGELRRGEVDAVPFRPRAYWPLALLTCETAPRTELTDALIETVRSTVADLAGSGAWPGQSSDSGAPSRQSRHGRT
ncbi:LysR family transcriptional regulator [Microvirga calopogonii]|uniref:LysR family transcriptional regulator n=1 Tax=Microvirga calopogonii TaxID=2078013 RepID=UPI000E0D5E83|nr:LysR family transcriptional regulator [Microvirga calopogonii]